MIIIKRERETNWISLSFLMSIMALVTCLLYFEILLIVAVTSNYNFKQYFINSRMNGYKCSGTDMLFNETGLDQMSCAMRCQMYSGCKSFMFKEQGGLCYGCNRVYAYPSESTVILEADASFTYSIDKDYETIFRISNDSMLADEGRIELRFNGTWGTVCDDRFYNHLRGYEVVNVNVLCASLGFNGGGIIMNQGTYSLADSSSVPIWLDDVECTGTEPNIAECPHAGFAIHDCAHNEDLGVKCLN